MNDHTFKEFDGLVRDWLEVDILPEEASNLAELVKSDPVLKKRFQEISSIEMALQDHFSPVTKIHTVNGKQYPAAFVDSQEEETKRRIMECIHSEGLKS